MKWCNRCKMEKSDSEFSKRIRYGKEGLQAHCRTCNALYRQVNSDRIRAYAKQHRQDNKEVFRERYRYKHIKRYYGLSREEYDTLLAEQDGRCAICYIELDQCRSVVDHDHRCCPTAQTCGECIRGLLCVTCNTGIGMLRDDYELVQRAADYLRPSEE